jgi:hypothetical protein
MPLNTENKLVSIDRPRHFCVCDGPEWGDAQFIAAWLSAVLAADSMIDTYLAEHPHFRSRISRLEVESAIEFRPAALCLLTDWLKADGAVNYWDISFHVDIEQDWYAELFAIMANVGFFKLQNNYYKMSIPYRLDINVVRKALLRLAKTEDCHYYLYPERLLHTMSWRDVKRCKKALRREKFAAAEREVQHCPIEPELLAMFG